MAGGNAAVDTASQHIQNNIFAGQNILDNGNVQAFASFAQRNGAGNDITAEIVNGKEVKSKADLYRLGKSFRKAVKTRLQRSALTLRMNW